MTRTRATPLIALAALGGVFGFLLEQWSEMMGRALVVPPLSMPLTLVAVAGVVVGFAIPIRRAVIGRSRRRVDPFQATRIVVLAKACSLVGSLILGFSIGILIYFLVRPLLPEVGSMGLAIASCVGAALLVAGGLVAEFLCTLPKDEDPDDDDSEPVGNAPA